MQNQALAIYNRVVLPLGTSSFCGRHRFLKRALRSEHPSRSFKALRTHRHCTRCLIATGGSDDEDDEPIRQSIPSTSGRGHGTASSGLGLNPDLEQPVPTEQRPVNELAALRETWLYSWVGWKQADLCLICFCFDLQLADMPEAYVGKTRNTVILDQARRCLAWVLCACGWAYCLSDL